jgi:maltose O-acetyltransferase
MNSAVKRILRGILVPIFRALDLSIRDQVPIFIAGGMQVGRDVSIQPGVNIDCSHFWHISIGDNVTIAPGVVLLAHDATTKRHLGYTRIGKISIGSGAFIGASSIVLPGISIGENSIVGAGSVVTSSVPPNVVACGNPARVICSLESFLKKRVAEMAQVPRFGAEYTLSGGVTKEMRDSMNACMVNRVGYIV